jgi:hypothetical protein
VVVASVFGGYCRCWRPDPRPPAPSYNCPQLTQCLPPHHPCAGSTLNHWPFPWKHLPEGYCYLLTHPGTPCVFYDHLYSDAALKTHILELMKIRKKHGINAKSEVGAARWVLRRGGWFDRLGAVLGWGAAQDSSLAGGGGLIAAAGGAGAAAALAAGPATAPPSGMLPAADARCSPAACPAPACRFWCARPTTSCMRLSLTRRWP